MASTQHHWLECEAKRQQQQQNVNANECMLVYFCCIFFLFYFSSYTSKSSVCVCASKCERLCVCVYGRSGMVDRLHYAHCVLAQIFKIGSEHGCTTLEKTKNKLEKDPEWNGNGKRTTRERGRRTPSTEYIIRYKRRTRLAPEQKPCHKKHTDFKYVYSVWVLHMCCILFYNFLFLFFISFGSVGFIRPPLLLALSTRAQFVFNVFVCMWNHCASKCRINERERENKFKNDHTTEMRENNQKRISRSYIGTCKAVLNGRKYGNGECDRAKHLSAISRSKTVH